MTSLLPATPEPARPLPATLEPARLDMRELLRRSPVRLAPMASFTNLPTREIAVRCSSGFTTNEEIDADALVQGSPRSIEMTRTRPAEGVVAMQLLGNSAESLVPAALRLVEAGASMIDINMGCPVPKIVRRGKGAALMRDVCATGEMLGALRRALDVPLTIKIRSGWDDEHLNAVEVARMAQDAGVDAITVHPRSRAQRFGGRAPWDVIAAVVRAVDIPVTGNGDVDSLAEARAMMAATGCESVMIGRAALGRPWIFDAGHALLDADSRYAREVCIVRDHLALIEEHFPPREALVHLKKQLALYSSGRPDARTLRGRLFALRTPAEVHALFREQWPPARSTRPLAGAAT